MKFFYIKLYEQCGVRPLEIQNFTSASTIQINVPIAYNTQLIIAGFARICMEQICVIGHPSFVGGADTELDHQIRCWHSMGKRVHICHTGELDRNCLALDLESRGCTYHMSRDWSSLEGLHCISFCNGEFLKELPEIKKHARSTTFVNCMTFNFDAEVEMQHRGLIDSHLYQTEHAFERVSKKLKDGGMKRYRGPFRFPASS